MLFALLFLLLAPPYRLPNADSLIVSNWTVDEGLPGNSVNRIIQDPDGFLWLTSYYGLVRFDGIEFQTLNQANTPQIRNNRLNLFHKSPDGTVWISLELMGLVRYDGTGFKRYDAEQGLSHEHITVMRTLPNGRLIVGTYAGLYVLNPDTDRFDRIDLGEDRRLNHITNVICTSTGTVWATTFNGYVRVDGATSKTFGSGEILDIVEDAQRRVWIGRFDGLYQLNPDGSLSQPSLIPSFLRSAEISSIHVANGRLMVSVPGASYVMNRERLERIGGAVIPEDDQISVVYHDTFGVTWVITQQGIPMVLRGNRFERIPELESLAKASVIQVIEDSERNLWFSSRYGGLFRVKRNGLSHIGRPEGLRGENTLGLFFDSRNRLFIGTRDDGFAVVENGKLVNYPTSTARRYGTVYDFAEDENGQIWIGTFPHGLVRFDEPRRALVTYRLGESVLENDIRAIHPSGNGFLWLATSAGLVRYDTEDGTFQRFDRKSGLPSQSLKNITVDSKGRMWLSTSDNGLFRFDPVSQDILHLNSASGLPSDHIRSVMIDPDDDSVLWIGSETEGLIRYRNGTFHVLGVDDGLPDRVVHSIRQGPLGWLWITTNAGVVRINKGDLNRYLDGSRSGFHFIVYDEDEGMRNLEANGGFRNASLISPDKAHLLVSTQSGVAFFPLAKPDPNRQPPPVFLLNGPLHSRQTHIELRPGEDDYDIHYAALRYASPYGVRYQYRMIGISDEWTDDFDRDLLHFNDLAPGEYRFEVISWNEAGTLSSEPAVLTLIVKPTLWQMPFFWLMMIIVVGGGVWWVIDRRTKTFQTIRERLEVLVQERTNALREEKAEVEKQKAIIEKQAANLEDLIQTRDKFFAIIGHDLRGPFQTLLGLSQLMLDEYDEMDDHERRQSLKHLRSSSENLHRLVENLLEWSTLQKGNMKLFIEPLDVNALAESTVRLFGPSASVKGIHLEAIVPDEMVVAADPSVVETIVRNFVSNAIKFTKTEGIVVLEAGLNETDWWIQVSDNGIGMTEAMRKNVLNIDKSVKRRGTMNEWGTGLGLALCQELIQVHGGEIVVESEVNVGSRFTARFHNRS
jgi:signal transduction histidine kinase/ligand-binding sensor domain-containing protein